MAPVDKLTTAHYNIQVIFNQFTYFVTDCCISYGFFDLATNAGMHDAYVTWF